jgi:DNA-binding IclR family transcriptional regulator
MRYGRSPLKARTTRQPLVQSVGRSLDLLEALAEPGELGLVELSTRAGLRPSTAHRLLSTLTERGYAVQSAATGRYLLGYKLIELAGYLSKRTEHLRALARPHLTSIQKVTVESTNLIVLSPPNVVYVDQVEGSRSVRMFARIGAAVPAHATAAGKAILAFMPEAPLRDVFGADPLPQSTPYTITSLDVLRDELARVLRRGYAIDNEEHETGVGCVAAPIFDYAATPVAAISISAPTQRIYAADPAELGELLMNRAGEISRELGFVAGPSGHRDRFHDAETSV